MTWPWGNTTDLCRCGHTRGSHAFPGALGTPCVSYYGRPRCDCREFSAPGETAQ